MLKQALEWNRRLHMSAEYQCIVSTFLATCIFHMSMSAPMPAWQSILVHMSAPDFIDAQSMCHQNSPNTIRQVICHFFPACSITQQTQNFKKWKPGPGTRIHIYIYVYKNIICTILEQLFSSFFLVATVYTNSFLECGQHALIGRVVWNKWFLNRGRIWEWCNTEYCHRST